AARGERCERAAVESALERNDAEPLGPALDRVVLARSLDGAFERLGAGIAEEHQIREGRGAQSLCEPLALRNAEQIGDVPDLLRLLAEHLDEMRMRVTERAHRDAGGEIQIALPIGRRQPSALAALEGHVGARIGGKQVRAHSASGYERSAEMKRAA